MTDNHMIKLLRSSPDIGRRALFDEYCDYVYAITASRLAGCGSREEIDECVSDVFAEIFSAFDDGRIGGDVKSALGMTAKRHAADYLAKIAETSDKAVSFDAERKGNNAELRERNRIIMEKIDELGDPDSTILIQQYLYSRTDKEIAGIVSLTAWNVQKRSARARERLKEMLLEVGISY